MKAKLSKRTVDAPGQTAANNGKTVYCYDTAMTGFGAYATAKGTAAYFVQYRLGGRGSPSKRLTIGKHGVITAEQAPCDRAREAWRGGPGERHRCAAQG